MRANGINEEFITGAADDWEKFFRWSTTVPKILGNPLYHWTHLELARYFGISQLLDPSTAQDIYRECNALANTPEYSVQELIRRMRVEYLCTTEDPTYDLSWHQQIGQNFEVRVSMAFRPDKVLDVADIHSFQTYLVELEKASGLNIGNYQQLCQVLDKRHAEFHEFGCRLADFALDWWNTREIKDSEANRILVKVLSGKRITPDERDGFRTAILSFLCQLNADRGWAQQFHIGALRNVNSKARTRLGDATGFDAINDLPYIAELARLLDLLERKGQLARSIFFNLNPRDNAALLALIFSFNDGSEEGKIQYGPAWWFLDQKDGMEVHLRDLSAYGVLGNFIGMLTDSRSFLSFPRHEYFRRILCNQIGKDVEEGLIPNDDGLLRPLIENICYYNAKKYLRID